MRLQCLALIIVALTASVSSQQTSQVPGTFRSTVQLVPVDVRVFDRNGSPVLDLRESDFTLLEDGVPQQIRHFSSYTLTADKSVEPGAKKMRRDAVATELAPQRRRTFLIVLGRGRLQGPSKGIDAALQFLRTRVLPQDEVSVMAYNRATDFSTEHDAIARVIERFRDAHHDIEARLDHRFSGLAGIYGTKLIPDKVQTQIDTIFRDTGVAFRTVPTGRVTDSGRIADDTRRGIQTRLNTDVTQGNTRPINPIDSSQTFDFSFEEYVSYNSESMTDLENIYTGIEYLRYLEGEKHLVFITERGLFLPRVEDDNSIAAMANDARVVLDTIQVGGVPGDGPTFTDTFAIGTLRTMAELTGGHASAYNYADKAFDHVDRGTRFQYLLGYSSTNSVWDGRYRRITVKVNRPNTTVSNRGGYYARLQLVPYNRKEFLTYSRIAAAAFYPDQIRDIKLKLKASIERGEGAEGDAAIELTIDISRLALKPVDGNQEAELSVTVFGADRGGNSTGEYWKRIKITIPPDLHKQALREGWFYALRVPMKNNTQRIKIVAYDYDADVIGTAEAKFY